MSDTIKFMLNDQVREVAGLPPTMTILQYLRLQERLTGTKEGCAEGDCGACTVIVGKLDNGKVEYEAINACIVFLPALDGRHLITVENLGMNAVQKAMVSCHGSQCGFCTPGFVMSLTACMNNHDSASDENIQDAISGNLCRCTGYRPILDAARMANKDKERHLKTDVAALEKLQRGEMFSYEHGGQKFFSPRTPEELAETYAQYPDATLLGGGTDVGLWVTKKHRALETVLYTGNIAALREIRQTHAGLEIGGAVSYAHAFESLAAYDPSMEVLLRRFASVQIRNLGTVGGNIANGSPIGDGPPPLIALNAKLVLRSESGAREMPLEEFFIAYGKQAREKGEFVERIIVPPKAENVLFKVYKISKRFDQDISAVCAAFAIELDGSKVASARIAFGGMAGTPKRAAHAEKALAGKAWNEETVRAAMSALEKDYQPLTDMRATAQYRMQVARNLLLRCFVESTEPETETGVYGYGN
ncbi:MAG: xanthine dehydrogenase small subunit [Alphaproteobacteria bacterium]|nr:xanthine dehydrogenase small subunit [Alphaproteobacteria bacterium]